MSIANSRVALLALVLAVAPASAAIVFDGTFATNDFSTYSRLQAAGQIVNAKEHPDGFAQRFELVESPTGSGRVAKISIRPDDALTARARRSEMTTGSARMEVERWYSWSYYVPGPWQPSPAHTVIITQFHDNPDSFDYPGHTPTLAFLARPNSTVLISNTFDRNAVSTSTSYESRILANYPLVTDEWTNIVVRARWSASDTGLLDIYKDGELIFSEREHPNTFNDQAGPYFKHGLYVLGPAHWDPMALYTKGLKIGDEKESLATMISVVPEVSTLALLLVGLSLLLVGRYIGFLPKGHPSHLSNTCMRL